MRTLLCAIAKMENNYLREWVEHHKQLGFDNICLYDNNDIDGERFEEVIGDYINEGYVIVKDVRGQKGHINWQSSEYIEKVGPYYSIQTDCYNACYHTLANDYDWICYLDIDEFIFFQQGWDLNKFLNDSSFEHYNHIGVSRIDMDDNNLVKVENGNYNCVERFTHEMKIFDWIMHKPFIRTNINMCTINCSHGFKWDNIFHENNSKVITSVLTDGIRIADGTILLYEHHRDKCFIRHYKTKTIEEYLHTKMQRKWPDDYDKMCNLDLKYFFDRNELTDEKLEYLHSIGLNYSL